ncbi:hypothetical protein GFH30_07255 [Acinetobacter wanghuae]|uniref:Uncharacterized protein n=1 Tax=Acinetobacter wanghuae TaxID=2662362 RepID=A0A5Q0P1X8_9GAMM|nr:hypothetical protein [Acinetobacter wanghuae]MQW91253.1 hypothetical protein [Acinetobacter wanghuae]QGA11197.1 hypothetical protein GFH30_07255 [Acinetobacter wanghuae]
MKEIFDAINTRIREPYWGFFVISFLAFNWRALFLLCFATGTAQEKIDLFDSLTTFWSLVCFPILMALAILLITPWLKVLFGLVSRLAYEKLNSQELVREHKYIAQKNMLEKERANALANKENELIDRAKRDVDIDQIADEETRNKLKIEIDRLRLERNKLINNNKSTDINDIKELSEHELELLKKLSESEDHCVQKKRINGSDFLMLNKVNIHEKNDSPTYYRIMDAITSLKRKGLIKDLNNEGKLFELSSEAKKLLSKINE